MGTGCIASIEMTPDRFKSLLDREFLRGVLHYEFVAYQEEGRDKELKQRLVDWAKRELKRETQAEGAFIQRFFVETWGYREDARVKIYSTYGPNCRSRELAKAAIRAKPISPSASLAQAAHGFRRSFANSRT